MLSNVFEIDTITHTDNTLNATVKLNGTDTVFKGHFPNNPITPGVLQINCVRAILEQHLGCSLQFKTMSRCKFLAILKPETTPLLNIEIVLKKTDNTYTCKTVGCTATQKFFSFNAVFEA